jgi:hypothetical protein
MEISTTGEEEERIAVLEKRVRDMEALVRGLIAELMDLKTVTMAVSRQDGKRSGQELKQGMIVTGPSVSPPDALSSDGSTMIKPITASQEDSLDTPAEPAMVRIMQADGTMKMEPRYGNKKTI